jgi:hypothetical protein
MTGFACEHILCLMAHKGIMSLNSNFCRKVTDPIWRGETFIQCFPLNEKIETPIIAQLKNDSTVIKSIDSKLRGRPKNNLRMAKFCKTKKKTKLQSKQDYQSFRGYYDSGIPIEINSMNSLSATPNETITSGDSSTDTDTSKSENDSNTSADDEDRYFNSNDPEDI